MEGQKGEGNGEKENGEKSARMEGRETREGSARAVSDGFHVLRSRAAHSRAELSWL